MLSPITGMRHTSWSRSRGLLTTGKVHSLEEASEPIQEGKMASREEHDNLAARQFLAWVCSGKDIVGL